MGPLTWLPGVQIHGPAYPRGIEHEIVTADFDNDGFPDLMDPSGAFQAGSAAGIVANDVVLTNQLVTFASHGAVLFSMIGAAADHDLDGDMDWAGVSISTTHQRQFEVWANVTRQLDFDVPSVANTLDISASTLPLATRFWCYDRTAVQATTFVMPFLAADLGPLPTRIPVAPFEGLLGLNLGSAVTIGGVALLVLPFAAAGQLQGD